MSAKPRQIPWAANRPGSPRARGRPNAAVFQRGSPCPRAADGDRPRSVLVAAPNRIADARHGGITGMFQPPAGERAQGGGLHFSPFAKVTSWSVTVTFFVKVGTLNARQSTTSVESAPIRFGVFKLV